MIDVVMTGIQETLRPDPCQTVEVNGSGFRHLARSILSAGTYLNFKNYGIVAKTSRERRAHEKIDRQRTLNMFIPDSDDSTRHIETSIATQEDL